MKIISKDYQITQRRNLYVTNIIILKLPLKQKLLFKVLFRQRQIMKSCLNKYILNFMEN